MKLTKEIEERIMKLYERADVPKPLNLQDAMEVILSMCPDHLGLHPIFACDSDCKDCWVTTIDNLICRELIQKENNRRNRN